MPKSVLLRSVLISGLLSAGLQTSPAAELMHEGFTPPSGCPASGYAEWLPDGWTRFNRDGQYQDPAFADGWSIAASPVGSCAAVAGQHFGWGSPRDALCTPALALPEQAWLQWTALGGYAHYRVLLMRVPPAADGSNLSADAQVVSSPYLLDPTQIRHLALHDLGYADETIYACFERHEEVGNLLYIDDVILRDHPLVHDLELKRISLPPYARTPANQAMPFELLADITNAGSAPLGDVRVSGMVIVQSTDYDEWPVSSEALPQLPAGAKAGLSVATVALDRPGFWSIDAAVESIEGDAAPFDNAAYELITHVNDLVLSRWESVTDTHVGVFGGHAGAELGHHFDLVRPATIAKARFRLADLSGSFWPLTPLNGTPVTAYLRDWDALAGEPGEILSQGTGFTGHPSGGISHLDIEFPPVRLPPGRYSVTLVDPDVTDEPMGLVLSRTTRERGTSWMNWLANPDARWVHFDEVDPAIDSDLSMDLFVVGDSDHYPYADRFDLVEDTPFTGSVADNDLLASGVAHVWSFTQQPSKAATFAMGADGHFSILTAPGFHGTTQMWYAQCVADVCRSARAEFHVAAVDEGSPIAVADVFVVPSDRGSLLDVVRNDTLSPDGGNFETVASGASAGTVYRTDGGFWYTPDLQNAPLQDSFTYRLCDSDGDCSVAEVQLEVVPVIFRSSFE